MEATKNAALAAVRAVWGNNGRSAVEPLSDVQGEASCGEPNDTGNTRDSNDLKRNGQATERSEEDDIATRDHRDSVPHNASNEDLPTEQGGTNSKGAESPGLPVGLPEKPGDGSTPSADPDDGDSVPHDTSDAGPPTGQAEPNSKGAEPSGLPTGLPEKPDDGSTPGADQDAAAQGESRLENAGGFAGAGIDAKEDRPTGARQEDEDREREEITTSKGHAEGGPGAGYRSSGLAKHGGDFDSKKPGAGSEAKRLMHLGALEHPDEDKKKHQTGPHLPIHAIHVPKMGDKGHHDKGSAYDHPNGKGNGDIDDRMNEHTNGDMHGRQLDSKASSHLKGNDDGQAEMKNASIGEKIKTRLHIHRP